MDNSSLTLGDSSPHISARPGIPGVGMVGLECLSRVLSEDHQPAQNILKWENVLTFAPENLEEGLRKLSIFIKRF